MATQFNTTIPGKLHNLSPAMLADLIGELDRKSKDAEAELKAAKEALKARGVVSATGDRFTVQPSTLLPSRRSLVKSGTMTIACWRKSRQSALLPSRPKP